MSKTIRFGGDGYFGEVPALKEPEDDRGNVPSGIAETAELGAGDYFVDPPLEWTDDDFYENAVLTEFMVDMIFEAQMRAEVKNEVERARLLAKMPVEEWPLADLKRVVAAVYGKWDEQPNARKRQDVIDANMTQLMLDIQEPMSKSTEATSPMRRKGCVNPNCGVSTGITDQLTFGSGRLSIHGFWQFPCLKCAEDFKLWSPGMAARHGVWPNDEDEARPDPADDPAIWGEVIYDEDEE